MAVSNIGKGAIISYVAIFLNIAISFLYTPWMLKQVGVSDFGLYNLILSFISYFVLDFGLGGAISRFIAKYRAEGDNRKVENVLGLTLRIFFFIDCIIFCILFVSYFYLSDIFTGLTANEVNRLKILYIIASTFSILSFGLRPLDGALTAYEFFVPAKVIDMVYKVGSVLLVVVAILLGGDIFFMVFINGFLSFATSLYRFFYVQRHTGIKPNLHYNDRQETKDIFSFSGWTFLIGMAQRFRLTLVPTVLGIFSNSEQIAVFSLGMTMEAMMWTLSSALNGLFLPKVSRLVHDDDKDGLMNLMINVGRIQLFIVTFILGSFAVCGRVFIELWVGDTFIDVYYIVIFLTITYILSTTMQIASDKVYAENKVKAIAIVTFITSIIGIIGSCCAAREYGALGCSLCSGIALVITQVGLTYLYQKRLSIDVVRFFKECHFRILLVLLILIIVFYELVNSVEIRSWAGLFVSIVIWGICYATICYCTLLNKYEKSIIKSLIKR